MGLSTTLPSYLIGTACIGVGLAGFASPARAYAVFGLPFLGGTAPRSAAPEKIHPAAVSAIPPDAPPSPFLYAKAVRDITFGIAFIVFEATENAAALSTMVGSMVLVGAVDGWIVWQHGGALRPKAWGHWNGSIVAGAWYALRLLR